MIIISIIINIINMKFYLLCQIFLYYADSQISLYNSIFCYRFYFSYYNTFKKL